MRRWQAVRFRLFFVISIHAPLAGCDSSCRVGVLLADISIHAPLAGCDWFFPAVLNVGSLFQSTHPLRGATYRLYPWTIDDTDFNPRTPCGVRPLIPAAFWSRQRFQSTHPLRGATTCRFRRTRPAEFQSTHPLRGATCAPRTAALRSRYFNPRTPCGVRHYKRRLILYLKSFQSTHPLRGATRADRAAMRA